ncbi:hypothetical protein QCE73_08955 [Caballeronia sp. LZ029]|uniref:hypothetical protein n=1 Tax=Caballeronia sp. LZ029 TaxID=3038564 RepID=UPI002857F43B|nr:hypothetical protein [Caballeronia sp. LZ029]MDR5743282.1 hypothetical protein [Caballeronia sp. LZ029]
MSIYFQIEATEDPNVVLVRSSANPNPERKPAMAVALGDLGGVLLLLWEAAQKGARTE